MMAVEDNLNFKAKQLQDEVDYKKHEIDEYELEIEEENKLFLKIAKERQERIQRIGKDRLKYTNYTPNGKRNDEFSFHDQGVGDAIKIKSMANTMTFLA